METRRSDRTVADGTSLHGVTMQAVGIVSRHHNPITIDVDLTGQEGGLDHAGYQSFFRLRALK